MLGPDLVGATLGIVGFGRIGQAVARRALGFEMQVLFDDPSAADEFPELNARKVDFETLLRQSDFISLHTPLTPETQGLMNAHAFSLVKPGAVLVNTARGGVIDQVALYHALKDGQLFAAAIDVSDPEPLPMDSPLMAFGEPDHHAAHCQRQLPIAGPDGGAVCTEPAGGVAR